MSKLFRNLQKVIRIKHGNHRNYRKIVAFSGASILVLSAAKFGDNENMVASIYGHLRFVRSLKIGLHISIDYYFSMLGLDESDPNYKPMMGRIHQRAANLILEGCLQNGGSYIKLGQGLVSLSHILPKEYVETLKSLQDKCLTREKDELFQIFKEDFGKSPTEMFQQFEMEPIAAASIAQVFKAKTNDNQEVAVKVQYIDLQKRFNHDVNTINLLLKIVKLMHPKFDFTWLLEDLVECLEQELDFVNEGKNAERCARDLKHLSYVHVPKVLWDHTSTRVLVTEFIDGCKINDVEHLTKQGFSLADIDRKLFEAFGSQIFQTGFVHADPHPGNVLVRKKNNETQLVLLDHGLYQEVSQQDRIALGHMWKAIVLNDHKNMKIYSEKLGVDDYELFAEVLTQAPLKSKGFKLKVRLSDEDMEQMTQFARDRFDRVIDCLQRMPRTLLLVIRNLNTIRAIAHDHGNPIDRYAVLAREATNAVFKECGFSGRVLKIYFEIVLRLKGLSRRFKDFFFYVLYKIGLAPDVQAIMAKANVNLV